MNKFQKIKSRLQDEKEFHDRWAKSLNLDKLSVYQAFEGVVSPEYRFAVKKIGRIKGKRILNVGCGAGEEAVYLAKNGAYVVAIDISVGMLKVAKKLAKKFKVEDKIEFKEMNVEKITLREREFDVVFGNAILHHIDIRRGIREFKRVLKKQGKVIFIEPLFYNPVINVYRKMAGQVRTKNEHALKKRDILCFKKHFKNVEHYEFQFCTLLIFCYFLVFEGVGPNKDRYWKKIIREGDRYAKGFNKLYGVDKKILKLFPPLRWWCWSTVIIAGD